MGFGAFVDALVELGAGWIQGEDAQVIPGFADALIGQQVGSQIGVIIPPSQGYGDQGNSQIPADSTLFFVIDVLGVI